MALFLSSPFVVLEEIFQKDFEEVLVNGQDNTFIKNKKSKKRRYLLWIHLIWDSREIIRCFYTKLYRTQKNNIDNEIMCYISYK